MTEMPCSFTGPKIFCASPDVLTRQKSDLANLLLGFKKQLCIFFCDHSNLGFLQKSFNRDLSTC